MSDVFVIFVIEMKRGLLAINSKRNNKLDNQQIKNRDMNTTKKWSLVAVLCGLFTITLLTACGGGTRNEPNPNKGNETNNENEEVIPIEQTLTLKSDRPIMFDCFAFGVFTLYVNGVDKGTSYISSDERDSEEGNLVVPANTLKTYHFTTAPHPYSPSTPMELTLNFSFEAKDQRFKDPNKPFDLPQPIETTVTFTWQEKINKKVTREESKTIILSEDNGWSYKSREYSTKSK